MRDGVAVTSLRGTGPGSFREWLRKYPVGGKYPHYIEALFELRPDVAAAMKGGPVEDTLLWIRLHGVRELQLIPALLEAPASDVSTRKPISYLGYVTSELGLGEAARGYMAALKGRGYSLDVVDISDTSYHKRSASYVRGASLNGVLPGGIKILHVNADSLPSVIERIPPETRKDSYCIGIWAWETLEFPDEWSDRFAMLDEIWVGSQFMARAISPKSPIPVVVMPHVIEMPEPQPDRALFGIDPDEYVFLLSFDFSSVRVRKNPLGAIEAFKRAFTPEEPVRLFVKSMHGDRWPEQFLTMRAAAEDGARITFYDGTLSGAQRLALLSSCDTYLSLHRAEGFGLGLAECMAFGKPVVATGWSGNMEFMTHQNAMLVNYQLKPLAAMAGPYPAGTLWAEPDLDDAARKMRQLWLDPELRARLGQQAKQDIAAGFSAQTIGSMLDARLKLVESSMGQAETQRTIRIEQPPSPRGQSFLRRKTVGALRRARRIIKRALA